MKKNKVSPVMLSGMHRSGTSMLTNILNKLGFTIGNKIDSNNESIFFQRINIWMMSLLGSSWDSPKKFENINEDLKKNIVHQLNSLLNSRTNSLYFGWSSIIKKDSFNEINEPWGWKDPRNTFTGTIWGEVFPDLRAIYIIRHPIDIAESLFKRQRKEVDRDLYREKKYTDIIKALLSIHHTSYNSSMLINSYNDCFELIELYFDQILENKINNSLVVRFEDIISNPETELSAILDYCNLSYNMNILRKISDSINSSRGFAYKNNEKLLKFEVSHANLIKKMGY